MRITSSGYRYTQYTVYTYVCITYSPFAMAGTLQQTQLNSLESLYGHIMADRVSSKLVLLELYINSLYLVKFKKKNVILLFSL